MVGVLPIFSFLPQLRREDLQDTVNIRISTLKTDTKQQKKKKTKIYMKLFELVTLQGQVQHNKY